jgi:hypothetical protein
MPNQELGKFLIGLGALTITLVPAPSARAQMSDEMAAQLSQNADQHVIVIMKSQHAAAHKDRHTGSTGQLIPNILRQCIMKKRPASEGRSRMRRRLRCATLCRASLRYGGAS